jgi:hypothetical protein
MQRTKTFWKYIIQDMTKEDIMSLKDTAEQTLMQFKERVTRDNKYDVSCEMVMLNKRK